MNLLVISSRYPFPLEKGDKLRLYHQIKELAKYHNITLVSVSDESRSAEDQVELIPYVTAQYHFDITTGVRMINRLRGLLTGIPIQVSQLYDSDIMRAIRKIAIRHHIEHVYCQLPRAAEYARRLPYPKTIDYMDAFGESMERRAKIQSGLWSKLYAHESKMMKKYETKIFAAFDHHTLISDQDRAYIAVPYPSRIHIVPNGIDVKAFTFGLYKPKSDIAFIGNLGYLPNEAASVYLVDEILPKLSSEITVQISGARPTHNVKSLASDQVKVVGWVDNIVEAYKSSKIFVAPIFAGTGQQNKILESMAVGLPCITTTAVNNAIMAQDGDEILIADSTDEFVDQINRILTDMHLYQRIQQNARKFVVDNYSWEQHVSVLQKIITNTKN